MAFTGNVQDPTAKQAGIAQRGVVTRDIAIGASAGLIDTANQIVKVGAAKLDRTAQASSAASASRNLSDFTGSLGELKREEATVGQQLTEVRNQIANTKDQKKIKQLTNQYGKLTDAAANAADPASLEARKQALISKFAVANPGLLTELNKVVGIFDGFATGVGGSGQGEGPDPILAAQNDMLSAAAKGVSVDRQIEAADLAARVEQSNNELQLRQNLGTLNFQNFVADAGVASGGFLVGVSNKIQEFSTDPEFMGLDSTQQKLILLGEHSQFVEGKMSEYIAAANSNGITLSQDQMNNLRTTLEGNSLAALNPVISQLDEKVKLQDQLTFQQNQNQLIAQRGIGNLIKASKAHEKMWAYSGGDNAIFWEMQQSAARAQNIVEARGGEIALDVVRSDAGLRTMVNMFSDRPDEGLRILMDAGNNPEAPIGTTPASDDYVRQVSVSAVLGSIPTTKGGRDADVKNLDVALHGNSPAVLRPLLSDKMTAKVKGNPHIQEGITNRSNFILEQTANELQEELTDEDGSIVFTAPTSRSRVATGTGKFRPAEAFSIDYPSGRAPSRDVRRAVDKLNHLYTLRNMYQSPAVVDKWATDASGRMDTKQNSFELNRLMLTRKRLVQDLERVGVSFFLSDEDIAEYKQGQQAQLNQVNANIAILKGEKRTTPELPVEAES